ncbi:MAG: molybdenum cofactor biosynthesis protein MoaE [Myxococcota bacterium]
MNPVKTENRTPADAVPTPWIALSATPINSRAVTESVYQPVDGAVVTFEGIVRNHAEGRSVRYLVYEAYERMAEAQLKVIAEEVQARWGLIHVAMVHRVGRLEIGDLAVVVAVGSPHRREAFEACHYCIDRLKETVPIWKKEYYDDADHAAEWKSR